jgi:hypothetical protein
MTNIWKAIRQAQEKDKRKRMDAANEAHPITRMLRRIKQQQESIRDQWIRDLKFRAVHGGDQSMVDCEHFNQLQATNDFLATLRYDYPTLTVEAVDIPAVQEEAHRVAGLTKKPTEIKQAAAGVKA